jgi:hypothetical protein
MHSRAQRRRFSRIEKKTSTRPATPAVNARNRVGTEIACLFGAREARYD